MMGDPWADLITALVFVGALFGAAAAGYWAGWVDARRRDR